MAFFDCQIIQSGGSGTGIPVIVNCDAVFSGKNITATDGTTTLSELCPATSPYSIQFNLPNSGTWTISGTVQGQVFTTTVEVQDVSAVLSYGFVWRTWVDTASLLDSSDYDTLDEVLADEEAVRELFREHAPVNYMAESTASNEDLETIIENDLCAKWINLSDYALDFLYANEVIADLMDTADKYGYGEWVITDDTTTPPTWGAKGNVPKMTSNTAPYGTASASATYSGEYPYYAFNQNESVPWESPQNAGSAWVQYSFPNPVCIKHFKVKFRTTSARGTAAKEFTIQASNDGFVSDVNTIYTSDTLENILTNGSLLVEANTINNDFYSTYRINITSTWDTLGYIAINTLQFYGRELSVSVPVMTGNTTPYGTAIASSISSSSSDAFKAFDGDATTEWAPSGTSGGEKIYYHFTRPMIPKKVEIAIPSNHASRITKGTIIGSNDGTNWTPLGETSTIGTSLVADLDNDNAYSYVGLECTNVTDRPYIGTLQIYGLDYSEKEFEVGTTKKWLYDHGVELEPLIVRKGSNAANGFERASDELILSIGGSGNNGMQYYTTAWFSENLSNYSLYRAIVGDEAYNISGIEVNPNLNNFPENGGSYTNNDGTLIAEKVTTPPISNPNTIALDVSSVTGNVYVGTILCYRPQAKITFKELWLE